MVWDIGTFTIIERIYGQRMLPVYFAGRKLQGEWTHKRRFQRLRAEMPVFGLLLRRASWRYAQLLLPRGCVIRLEFGRDGPLRLDQPIGLILAGAHGATSSVVR